MKHSPHRPGPPEKLYDEAYSSIFTTPRILADRAGCSVQWVNRLAAKGSLTRIAYNVIAMDAKYYRFVERKKNIRN